MNDIKLIVCDVDATVLVPGNKEISRVLKQAFDDAYAKGIEVVIDTGRHYKFLPPSLFDDLPMDYIGTINGACLTDRNGQTIAKDAMTDEQVQALVRICEENGIGLGLKFEDTIVSYANHDVFVNGYCGKNQKHREMVIDDTVSKSHHLKVGNPLGVFLIGDESIIDKYKDKVPGMTFAWSYKHGYDVFQNRVTKATAIDHLLEIKGLSWENVIAFGDAGNDSPMIEKAGIGVAMGNSKDDVKRVADKVADTCENDGVAKMLRELKII